MLPEVGEKGQQKLRSARVLIVGVGGLGSPAAMYLAAAGVGTIGLVDDDVVDISNLQRQIIHSSGMEGNPKVSSAGDRLCSINPLVEVKLFRSRLTSQNALEIIEGYDVVVDASDNFPTRYLVNDACVLLGKPDVYGSVLGFEGHASVFFSRKGPCYRCLHPEPPPASAAPTCADAGVLGVLPGVIGTIQATEALKLVLGVGEPLFGRVMIFDAHAMKFTEMKLPKDPDCVLCGQRPSITQLIDYETFCSGKKQEAAGNVTDVPEISVRQLKDRLERGEVPFLLDVRESYEYKIANLRGKPIPLGELPARMHELDRSREVIVYCHHGHRSWLAVEFLKKQGFGMVKNLTGGIDAWAREIDPQMPRY